MAMSETMPNPTNNWVQLYQQVPQRLPPSTTIDTTVVTTNATSPVMSSTPDHHHLSPDHGRVSKPIRRRTRASRRTPTTVLNTDTTNFRAMVQQFTGGPVTAPFPSHATYLGFGWNNIHHQQQTMNPTAATNSGAYNNIQFQQPQPQPQNQHQAYMFSSLLGSNIGRPTPVQGHGEPNFPHRLSETSGSSPSNDNNKTTTETNFML